MKASVEYLSRETMPSAKDPSKVLYKVLLMQGTDTMTAFTTEQVYAQADGLKKCQQATAEFDYNDHYRSLRLVSIA